MKQYKVLTTKHKKEALKYLKLYSGAISHARDDEYKETIRAFNKKYLKIDTDEYTEETDKALRTARNMEKAGVKNFSLAEFRCNCDKHCHGYPRVMQVNALKGIQKIRDKYGATTITCGLRCKGYNDELAKKGWAIATSQHTKGNAIDFYTKKCEKEKGRAEVVATAKQTKGFTFAYFNHQGSHPNMGNCVHIDWRG